MVKKKTKKKNKDDYELDTNFVKGFIIGAASYKIVESTYEILSKFTNLQQIQYCIVVL